MSRMQIFIFCWKAHKSLKVNKSKVLRNALRLSLFICMNVCMYVCMCVCEHTLRTAERDSQTSQAAEKTIKHAMTNSQEEAQTSPATKKEVQSVSDHRNSPARHLQHFEFPECCTVPCKHPVCVSCLLLCGGLSDALFSRHFCSHRQPLTRNP